MKFDGHVKLTLAAVQKVKQNCPAAQATCRAPMFRSERFRIWFGDARQSTPVDNYSAAIVNYTGHALAPDVLFQVKLPDAVAFVDLDERWTHTDPKGQRYHFMRAAGETELEAYYNGCTFIRTHTENWVNHAKRNLKKKVAPLVNSNIDDTRDYVAQLALALHALQDSFSPGHTRRGYDDGPHRPGHPNHAAPIREIHVYDKQDHDDHGDDDYESGGIDSAWGRLAVEASADLITLGILSIPSSPAGLTGWESFKRKWLQGRLPAGSSEPSQPGVVDPGAANCRTAGALAP